MGCNCGASKAKAKLNYEYAHPKTGTTTVYKSEIEARAAQIRNGGGTYKAVARR